MKLALLGRDGVINHAYESGVRHRSQLTFIEGSIQALVKLSQSGYTNIIVTHQPGISRGLYDLDELEAIHTQIVDAVEKEGGQIAAILYCPHDVEDRCHCRPPNTGLLDIVEIEFDCSTQNQLFFYSSDEEQALIKAKLCHGIKCHSDNNLIQAISPYL
jgi:D-glycero-D-manno-heptose 1,7-bisphosphate phosphatase